MVSDALAEYIRNIHCEHYEWNKANDVKYFVDNHRVDRLCKLNDTMTDTDKNGCCLSAVITTTLQNPAQ